MGDALMAGPQTYADAEVFAPQPAPSENSPLVYGPGSAYSGHKPTPEQYKYAYDSATTRDPRAPEGSAVNPTYDTPDITGKGLYHVDLQGRMIDEHPQGNLTAGKSLLSDADVFGTHSDENFDPAKTYDMRPTSQTLGAAEGATTVGRNALDALSLRMPGAKASPAAGPGLYLGQLAGDIFNGLARNQLDRAEKTQRPGLAGKIGTEAALTLPLAFTGEGAPLLIGAAQGDLTSESQDPLTRLRDIGIGAVGGKAGDMVAGGVKGALWPNIRPEAQWGLDNNIRLTPGGIMGGFALGAESGASKGTIAGPMVGSAQRQGIEDFNLATARHVLDGTGLKLPEDVTAGHPAVNATQNLLSGAFNALAPKLSLAIDPSLTRAISDATSAGTLMPSAYRARLENIIGQLPVRGGNIDGRAVQDITAQLRNEAADAGSSGDFFAKDYGRTVGKLQSAVEDSLERTNPDQAAQLQALRSAWAKHVRVVRASRDAVQDDGVYTPKGLLAAVRSSDNSVNDNATARGEALLQDWANSGKAVLPDKLPSHGSIWSHLPELAVTLGVGHEAGLPGIGGILAGEGALAGLYTKPAQDIIRTILTKRPGGAKAAADLVQKLAPLSLTAGASVGQNAAWPALQSLQNGNRP